MSQSKRALLISMAVGAGALGCETAKGDLTRIVALPGPPPEPSRPVAPSRPPGFPVVALLWERTLYPDRAPPPPTMPLGAQPAGALARLAGVLGAPVADSDREPVVDAPRKEAASAKAGSTPPRLQVSSLEILKRAGIEMPFLHRDATPKERAFFEMAQRAMEQAYVEDMDDTSVLMSLYEKMTTDADLVLIVNDWRDLLERAIEHAETLQRVNGPVRGLRRAFANAKPGDPPGLYTGVDHTQCRSAFAELRNSEMAALSLEISIEPLGRHTLDEVEVICAKSFETEMKMHSFPPAEGPLPLKALVRKIYGQAFTGKIIYRVAILQGGWEVLPDESRRLLRAVVGVKPRQAAAEEPCLMEEISVTQYEKGRGRYGPPVCCEVQSSVPISCDQLQ